MGPEPYFFSTRNRFTEGFRLRGAVGQTFWGGEQPGELREAGIPAACKGSSNGYPLRLNAKSEDGRVAELGLRHSTRNRTWGNTHRGFESRPFRQLLRSGMPSLGDQKSQRLSHQSDFISGDRPRPPRCPPVPARPPT